MSDQPTVVLTGASAGIGLAILEALVDHAFVIAVSRTPPPLEHANCRWVEGDLTRAERVADRIKSLLRAENREIDGAVYCAVSYGSTKRHALQETSDTEWDEIMAINARSQFVLTARFLPQLLARPRAFIVTISSDAATRPAPGRVAYACSKAASHALFTGLAAELGPSSLSVIELMPAGQVATRGLRARRAPDHDFSGYSSPRIFQAPLEWIVLTRGEGMNGLSLIIT